jgi:hypothetical protein
MHRIATRAVTERPAWFRSHRALCKGWAATSIARVRVEGAMTA